MSNPSTRCRLGFPCLMILAATACPCSQAITILSGPDFEPALNAPLAGTLQLTTDVDSRISVLVNDGVQTWQRNFYDYATNHSMPLLGFKADRTNAILVTVQDKLKHSYTASQVVTFVTAPLPADFPHSDVLTSDPARMEPGYTLFLIRYGVFGSAYMVIVDNSGEVVWYVPWTSQGDFDVRQLENGDLVVPEQLPLNQFIEINMLGDTVATYAPPAGYPINNHEDVWTPHGTILYLSDASVTVSNFPSSATDPNAPLGTVSVDDNPVVEISATNGALLNVWSPAALLDPTRVTYLTYEFKVPLGVDNEHANAIIEDPRDNSLMVSLRSQNAVFKFTRAGQLKWILGPHEGWAASFLPYLLTPVGTPFEWNYGQHAPELTPMGTLLLYDDGDDRASQFAPIVDDQANYSRAVEYAIDETNMTVTQVWDSSQAGGDRFFTRVMGDVDWQKQTRDVLVTYSYINYINGVHPSPYAPNATMVRIREYTHDPVPEIVFDLSFFDNRNTNSTFRGYVCYRSDRIPDLYAHPARAVADLQIAQTGPLVLVQFSADPFRSYTVQASADLQNWTDVGAAIKAEASGSFEFVDQNAGDSRAQFYRVVTH